MFPNKPNIFDKRLISLFFSFLDKNSKGRDNINNISLKSFKNSNLGRFEEVFFCFWSES